MSKPNRLYFSFHDYKMALRVQPHREDATKVVIKAKDPEAIDNLAIITGVDLGITNKTQGKQYFICFAEKQKLAQACGVAILHLEEPGQPKSQHPDLDDDDDDLD